MAHDDGTPQSSATARAAATAAVPPAAPACGTGDRERLVDYVLDLHGIGDVFTALPTLHGLQRGCPTPVRFVVRDFLESWARLGWDYVTSTPDGQRERILCVPDGFTELEVKGGVSRHRAYAQAAGVEPLRAQVKIPAHAREWAARELSWHKRPLALISPFTACTSRQWPLSRWLHLEDRLRDEGYGVVVLDSPGDGRRTEPFLSTRYWGAQPAQVAAMIECCDVLVGNDSGMVHIAGTLGRRAVALAGPTLGSLVYAWYDSVHVLQGSLRCSPCYWGHWSGHTGYHRACDVQCDALATITVDEVFAAMRG